VGAPYGQLQYPGARATFSLDQAFFSQSSQGAIYCRSGTTEFRGYLGLSRHERTR
jgi:hypothetical protein